MSHFWRMTTGKIVEGVFAINKPTGLSSAQVLRDLQHHFNPSELFAPWMESETKSRDTESHNQKRKRKAKKIQVKLGHGGTLDPLATGVLITGVGKGTKSLQNFLECTKVYETVVLFGTSTDTYDRVGKVLKRAPYDHVTKEKVADALGQFRGKFDQLPPLFSALKMNGKPLYEYAREGKEIPREIERRPVDVLELEMLEWMEGGTHDHKAPTNEAGYAEVNVANKLWKQEGALPTGQAPAEAQKNGEDKPVKVEAGEEDAGKSAAEHVSVKLEEEDVDSKNVDADKANSVKEEADQTDFADREQVQEVETEQPAGVEQHKRKADEEDDLVRERPPTKRKQKDVASSADAVMSGGLEAPESTATSPPPVKSQDSDSDGRSAKGPPAARLRMTVTSGFYVRSFCHDLGTVLGSAGLMAELERTRQGEFELGKNVLEYSDLAKGEKVWGPKVDAMIDEWNTNNKPAAPLG